MRIPRSFVISKNKKVLFELGDRLQLLLWYAVTIRGVRFALGTERWNGWGA
jgi:hypothetical protein